MVAAGLLMGDSIRQLVRVAEIDWSGMVVDIQCALSKLRKAKIVQFKWIILMSPLVGFSALIIGAQALLDQLPEPHLILEKVNPWWVASNYVFGVLFLLFGHVLIGYLVRRFGGQSWWQRIASDISGVSIRRAEDEIQRWAILDREMS